MKKTLLFTLSFLFIFSTQLDAQKAEKEKKEKKEKTEKVKKEKKAKGKKGDSFKYDTEDSEDYKKEDRAEVSKPEMPLYNVDQTFHVGKKRKAQQEAFKKRKYFFPSKPHHAWQLGVFGGLSILNGDVTPNFFSGNKPALPGHNFGLHLTKAWSYVFATRLRYSTFTMFTNDGAASTLTSNQFNAITNTSSGLPGYNAGGQFFHNSRTQGHDLALDLIISFGNVAFHKERTNFNFKVFPSVGVALYQTFYDHLDENGVNYDYATLANLNNQGVKDRGAVINDLAAMRDGKYETKAEEHSVADEHKVFGYNPRVVFGIGGGFTFRLAKWLYLDVETRQMMMSDDLLDGMQWQEPGTTGTDSKGQTRNFDSYNQTTLGLTFNLVGKKTTEPLTMLNPMHYSYQKVAEADPEKAIDDLLKDDDGDGVPNRLDQEENTVKGAPVDPKGKALDSDNDGIIDFNDSEPFSPPGFTVDDKGVAIGTDEDLKGKVETIVNNMDMSSKSGGYNCDALSIELPSVHFDKDKYNIKPEYYAHLYEVAERLLSCPDAKIVAVGMADKDDNTKYNEQLSYNRVDAVIDYITKTYGVDRNRFIVKYNGEASANGKTSSEQYEDRKVSFKLAEGETGDSNPAEPHPGMKAGKAK